jgi:UDP-N-acetylglucosamine--N-acetylmuramyl-(pentapeptide) pyrophosphoryl-undecaprenol N-acetylglucosamine transferase
MTPKILFAGGGTAGHVEPALAVASWLRNVKPNWEYVFVGTKNGLENQLVPIAGFNLTYIPKVLMPRQLTPETFIWPIKMIFATWQAIKICKEVDLVIGFGGYACPPIYLAAAILRKGGQIGWEHHLLLRSSLHLIALERRSAVGEMQS